MLLLIEWARFYGKTIYKKTKTPIESAWNKNWSVERWRHLFTSGDYNMGILLGDIVDVEADSEEANDLLERIIDGCQRPRFRSSKSIHIRVFVY